MLMSVNNAQVKFLTKLKKRKYQDLHNQIVVEGDHLVNQAEARHLVIQKYTTDKIRFPNAELISDSVLHKITTTKTPQKIIALIKKPTVLNPEEIMTIIDNHSSKILILDQIQDPGNIGTILRTAKAFSVDLVILSSGCCSIFNSKVILSSQGAFMDLVVYENANLIDLINNHQRNYVVTSLSSQAKSLQKNNLVNPTLIFGNEGNGVSQEIMVIVKNHLKITINESVESLNVAIACAIGLYHFFGNGEK